MAFAALLFLFQSNLFNHPLWNTKPTTAILNPRWASDSRIREAVVRFVRADIAAEVSAALWRDADTKTILELLYANTDFSSLARLAGGATAAFSGGACLLILSGSGEGDEGGEDNE